ncbi:DUF5131 family protein [Tessaracoccus sp.]
MGDKTGIAWTDATWNPMSGCVLVSPGCQNCYAQGVAERFRGTTAYPNGFDLTLRPHVLDQPLRWQRPRMIFVNSMSDLFFDQVDTAYIAKVFAVMSLADRHTFQVLTKRPGRMRSLLNSTDFITQVTQERNTLAQTRKITDGPTPMAWPLPNVWLGTSVENQEWADVRIPVLMGTPAVVRFLSCEPLLGPVDLTAWTNPLSYLLDAGGRGLDWVIVGGESGPNARPMHSDWVRDIRDRCKRGKVPFFFKQWGAWGPGERGGDPRYKGAVKGGFWSYDGAWAAFTIDGVYHSPDWVLKVGPKAAGAVLDDRTWDEFPGVSAGSAPESH